MQLLEMRNPLRRIAYGWEHGPTHRQDCQARGRAGRRKMMALHAMVLVVWWSNDGTRPGAWQHLNLNLMLSISFV